MSYITKDAAEVVEHSFQNSVVGASTDVDVMAGTTDQGPGLAILNASIVNDIGVSVLHDNAPSGGTWTLKLWKKLAAGGSFSEVATFTFNT